MIIIFWEFLLFCETFLSPQVKRHVIISNKYGIKSFTHELPKNVRLRKLGNIKEISKRHTAIAMPPKKPRHRHAIPHEKKPDPNTPPMTAAHNTSPQTEPIPETEALQAHPIAITGQYRPTNPAPASRSRLNPHP